jgi:hypothetical protein
MATLQESPLDSGCDVSLGAEECALRMPRTSVRISRKDALRLMNHLWKKNSQSEEALDERTLFAKRVLSQIPVIFC